MRVVFAVAQSASDDWKQGEKIKIIEKVRVSKKFSKFFKKIKKVLAFFYYNFESKLSKFNYKQQCCNCSNHRLERKLCCIDESNLALIGLFDATMGGNPPHSH